MTLLSAVTVGVAATLAVAAGVYGLLAWLFRDVRA